MRDRIAPTQIDADAGGQPLRGQVHDPTSRYMGGVAGHAGVYTTADDLAKYAEMLLGMKVIAAAIVGALVGSRLLGVLEQIPVAQLTFAQLLSPGGGKTIVGGLLGGWLSVEIKKWSPHQTSKSCANPFKER